MTNSNTTAQSLKRLLQRHLKHLVEASPKIQDLEKDCESHIKSLANLLEQRECVERVDVLKDHEDLSIFPDLKSMLMVKISAEVDSKLDVLKEKLLPLKKVKDDMQKARSEIMAFAMQHGHLDQPELEIGSPTVPPMEKMLNWIDFAEQRSRELYCARIFILDEMTDQDSVTSANLVSLWNKDAGLLPDTIHDCQEQLKYFLEEKVS